MVSFIIPAKDEAKYILDCLASIFNQEGVGSFEVVVVDNNSTDNTAELVRTNFPQARVVMETNPGTITARQRGYIESKGDILVFLDADVRLPRTSWLAGVVDRMEKDKEVVLLSAHYRYYDFPWYSRLMQTVSQFAFVYTWLFIVNNLLRLTATVVGGMTVIRRSALEQAGGLTVDTQFFGDEVLLTRKLYPFGRVVVSPKYWVYNSARRFKDQGLVRTVAKYVFNYFWVLLTKHPYDSKSYKSVR